MKIHRGTEHLPVLKGTVITIGTFDGFHLGHRQIIRQLKQLAAVKNGESVVITFEPHPRNFFGKEKVKLLSVLEEKLKLLEEEAPDHVVIVDFNEAFSSQTADEYIREFLVSCFHPAAIVIGYDHRFGRDRSGELGMLRKWSEEYNYEVMEISPQMIDAIAVSSTKVRQALELGEIEKANALLTYPYRMEAEVIHGKKKGRELGYPTANLGSWDALKLIPADGVYVVRMRIPARHGERAFGGMMNIGNRPVFDGFGRAAEVHLFQFDEDIYGEWVEVEFVARLRDEKKFSSVEELIENMKQDALRSREILSKTN